MNKPNITPDVFRVILKFMYTGTIVMSDNMLSYYLDILIAADELALIELIDYLVEYILKKETFWFRRNLVKIHRISSQHEAFHKLKTTCEEIIQKDSSTFLRSKDIGNLEESILIRLLKSDNLDLKEIEIWNQIIKWGKVQCSLNSNDKENIKDWSTEDFDMLRSTLANCLSHGPTIVIIKPSGVNKIIGGYNADVWNKNQKYDTVTNSFIFSLGINNEDDTGICSRVKNNVNKVGCAGQEKLPWFGNDLNWIKGVCKQQIYEKQIVDFEKFNSEDVEVYKVLLKVNNNNIFFDEYNDDHTTIFNSEIIEY
ncbi:unnamed protein product [Rhizophagus irregularis]|nr:unnamed protein product [Rhizophagus irregularis]